MRNSKQFLLSINFEDCSKYFYFKGEDKSCFKLYPARPVTGKTIVFDHQNIRLQYGPAIQFDAHNLDLRTFCIFLIAKNPYQFKEIRERAQETEKEKVK
jgi:hypothetical protein